MAFEVVPMVFRLYIHPVPALRLGRWSPTILQRAMEF